MGDAEGFPATQGTSWREIGDRQRQERVEDASGCRVEFPILLPRRPNIINSGSASNALQSEEVPALLSVEYPDRIYQIVLVPERFQCLCFVATDRGRYCIAHV